MNEPTATHDGHDGTMKTMKKTIFGIHRVHRVIVFIVRGRQHVHAKYATV